MTSLSDSIFKAIDDIIHTFIDKVSDEFKIEKSDLINVWKNNDSIIANKKTSIFKSDTPVSKSPASVTSSENKNMLLKMTKNELVAMCKSKGLKVTGTKNELVDRIMLPTTSQSTSPSGGKQSLKSPQIVKKLVEKIPVISIKKNSFGNYEHEPNGDDEPTGFVFDNKSQKVYGKQNKNGTISKLVHADIDLCNKYKFDYVIPDNLNSKVDDEVEDELDDDEELEEGELEENEENEELEEELEEIDDEIEYDEEY